MSAGPQTETSSAGSATSKTEPALKEAYWAARSVLRWTCAGAYFFTVCPLLILLGIFADPRKNDGPQRWLSRNTVRFAGARVEVRRSPGFDPARTCFFVSNHVNLFDPFVLYNTVP